jgi:ubiquinone biosynthesis protein Coq4
MKDIIIELLYENIKIPYQILFKKNKEWLVTRKEMLQMPTDSLGFHYACFLIQNNFTIQKNLEEHDAYHILTKIGTTVLDEIYLQWYLFGNGKRSLFVFIVIGTGLLFYPNKYKSYYQFFKKGKRAHPFHHLNFQNLLLQPIQNLQVSLNIKN